MGLQSLINSNSANRELRKANLTNEVGFMMRKSKFVYYFPARLTEYEVVKTEDGEKLERVDEITIDITQYTEGQVKALLVNYIAYRDFGNGVPPVVEYRTIKDKDGNEVTEDDEEAEK